ncbi:phage antirepressor KilAC domain-containing protein [Methylobacterium sp. E-046]|uniref:phage antirepressor KilAC domain-containing protein n=1 Tax=Methylobacterium sp. E-046 TaxID=2836576 RepID=UPI001FB9933E|nr:phage antirepressor KilAC domain-containing protein [Methylobacterium sp. E-046]MCJ2098968.1 phage antirepressor KilAC domain-containing protein [Methylobacterium sp. E-046]
MAASSLPIVAEVPLHQRDGEARVLDADLGQRLGLARPTNIRQVIEANRAEIEAFGGLHSVRVNPGPQGGRPSDTFYLTEEQALCTATLSRAPNAPAVRAMLIRLWSAYRRGQIAVPSSTINVRDPGQLAVIATQLIEVNRELAHRAETAEGTLAIAAPKAAALDRIADTEGLILPSDAAKALRMGPKQIGPYLTEIGWCFRRATGRLAARQDRLNAGLLDQKIVSAGEGRTDVQIFVTPKGLTILAQKLGVNLDVSRDLFGATSFGRHH